MINFINRCPEHQCECDEEDCIEKHINYINSVETDAEAFCEINHNLDGLDKIRVQVDSGAVDTVGPKSIGRAFKLKETPASRSGKNYVAANGSAIKNYGELLIKGETEHGLKVSMPIQIADVKKVLMSTHKMNETGLKVVLDGINSFFVEKSSGKTAPIKYVR